MTAVLITGMSGTGKSTVLAELAGRGHRVVDTDDGDWVVRAADGEPLWDEPRMRALLGAPGGRGLFVAGCVANQGRFYDRFSAVVLLSVPEQVLLQRIAERTSNDFGKRDGERDAILADLHAVEPLLRRGATAEIDTRSPVSEVADRLEAIARLPAGR
jgi:adenylate kinase family enzyme